MEEIGKAIAGALGQDEDEQHEAGGDGGDDGGGSNGSGGKQSMCNAICWCMASPFFMLGAIILLGWNEKRAVCVAQAIDSGRDAVTEVGCSASDVSSASSSDLIMFTCELSMTTYSPLAPTGEFSVVAQAPGVCINVDAQMFQCMETAHTSSSSSSSSSSSGSSPRRRRTSSTTTTYSYSTDWASTYKDPGAFHETGTAQNQCVTLQSGGWPSGFPTSSTTYAQNAKAGSWTISQNWLNNVNCDVAYAATSTPSGYVKSGDYYYKPNVSPVVGNRRVRFFSSDTANPQVTALGKSTNGVMDEWTAPDSWLCSGETISKFVEGTSTKDELFDNLEDSNTAITWLCRIIGFFVLWCAWNCCGGPLEVAADCVPFIGGCLGDVVEAVVCAVSCLPASGCCMCVCGIVWVAMRPYIGIPLMIVCICCFGGLAVFFMKTRAERKSKKESEDSGGGEAPPPQPAMQPIQQQPVMVPAGGMQPMMMPNGQPMMMPMGGAQPMMMPTGQPMMMSGGQPMMMMMPNGQPMMYQQPQPGVQVRPIGKTETE